MPFNIVPVFNTENWNILINNPPIVYRNTGSNYTSILCKIGFFRQLMSSAFYYAAATLLLCWKIIPIDSFLKHQHILNFRI